MGGSTLGQAEGRQPPRGLACKVVQGQRPATQGCQEAQATHPEQVLSYRLPRAPLQPLPLAQLLGWCRGLQPAILRWPPGAPLIRCCCCAALALLLLLLLLLPSSRRRTACRLGLAAGSAALYAAAVARRLGGARPADRLAALLAAAAAAAAKLPVYEGV